ncbi:MAG: alpha/beta fold hydrolase [Patescibacteria group bacterium]
MPNSEKTFVFIPGLGYKSSLWNEVQRSLSGNFSSASLDIAEFDSLYKDTRLNFDTYPAYLKDLIARLGIPKPFGLVGHSLGGLISLKYAARYPSEVDSLTLISTPLKVRDFKIPLIYRLLAGLGSKFYFADSLVKTLLSFEDVFPTSYGLSGYFDIGEFLKESSTWSVCKCYNELFTHDFSEIIKNVKIPVTLYYGRSDKHLINIGGTGLYKTFKKKRIFAVNCNHCIPKHFPNVIVKGLEAY